MEHVLEVFDAVRSAQRFIINGWLSFQGRWKVGNIYICIYIHTVFKDQDVVSLRPRGILIVFLPPILGRML